MKINMKKTYIQPQQQAVKVAPHNALLIVSVTGDTLRVTVEEGEFNPANDEII